MSVMVKPYPEYKDSGLPWLGKIPKHWELVKTKYLFRERSSKGFPNEPLLAATQTKGVVRKALYENRTVLALKDLHLLKLVRVGDFVISLRSFQGGIEYAHYQGIISPAYTVLYPSQKANPKFFAGLLKSKPYIDNLSLFVTGIRQGQNIDYERLSRSFLPVPRAEEQDAIAAFLAHTNRRFNRLIGAKRRLIELLNEQKQVIIHRAVTRGLGSTVRLKPSGIEWLGDVPEHWEVKKLKYNVRFLGGGTPSKAVAEYWNGDVPWVSPKDMKTELIEDAQDHITQDAVERSSTRLVDAGAVLLVVRSGILRRSIPVAINQRAVALNQDMKALVSRPGLTACYLAALIRGNQHVLLGEWTKQGATVESVEHELLANTLIPVPPVHEQQAIVASLNKELSKVNQPKDRARREIDLLREYRTRLIAEVVTGKVDVRALTATLPEINTDEPLDDAVLDEGTGSTDDLDDAVEHAAMSFDE